DLVDVLTHLHQADPEAAIPVVGYSVGGSRLLNYLADHTPDYVPAAVAVSVPLLLGPCSERLDQGFSRLYRRRLIDELLLQLRLKHAHLSKLVPEEAARLHALGPLTGVTSFRDFDNRFVAPLHG